MEEQHDLILARIDDLRAATQQLSDAITRMFERCDLHLKESGGNRVALEGRLTKIEQRLPKDLNTRLVKIEDKVAWWAGGVAFAMYWILQIGMWVVQALLKTRLAV